MVSRLRRNLEAYTYHLNKDPDRRLQQILDESKTKTVAIVCLIVLLVVSVYFNVLFYKETTNKMIKTIVIRIM